jgi:hypothetical protein
MCLQGFDQSGHEQSVSRSLARVGNSDTSAAPNSLSMSCGISPAISFASTYGLLASSAVRRAVSAFPSGFTPMRIRYGVGCDPCTFAVTEVGWMSTSSTCPLRAYVRARASRPPRFSVSSTFSQRWPHQLVANAPRFERALIPPFAAMRFAGGGK